MRKLYFLALGIFFLGNSMYAQNRIDPQTLGLIRNHAVRLHLSEEEINNAIISSSYVDPATNIRYVYLQQAKNNIKVYNGIKTIIFRDGDMLYTSGNFVSELATKTAGVKAMLDATVAVSKAAEHLKLNPPTALTILEDRIAENKIIFSAAGIAKKEITAELYWVASHDQSQVKLAWNINIDVLGSADWWNVRVDANTGEILEKDNWTVHETAGHKNISKEAAVVNQHYKFTPPPPTVTSASYFVVPYPYESPLHHALQTENQPWLKAGASNPAVTNGWHFDGTNNYNITRGNNVFAYLDVQSPNNTPNATTNWPDTSSTSNPSLTFSTVPTFTQQPGVRANRKAALTNLFYWNNVIHDITYQYGFNEVSGNFQTDNLGRGGNGNDYVQAEAQDNGGMNNANFSTPNDGSRPRMQMYLWTGQPAVIVTAPATIAGSYGAVESIFSTANKLTNVGPVTGQVIYFNDATGGTHDACSGPPINSLTGKIALINRSTCNFTTKVKEAQTAGAIGVIMVNNVAGGVIAMGGTDNTITIPAVMISQADGAVLAAQLSTGVTATLSAPIAKDGDYDNGIVVHEYGHGISNRLTGGPGNSSCLSNAEQAGEGWSDFLSLMLTTDWATALLTDGSKAKAVGNYATSQSLTGDGIRNYPYSTNMAVNPLTYANMTTGSTEVHFTGEIWCSALWDMTWNIIQQQGSIEPNFYNSSSNGGNVIAMKLVMEGMRLQPCQPGFLDARDAILAADSILYNGAHRCAIWKAFARRGMGYSAKQGLSTSATDQVAAYDIPSGVYLSKNSAPLIVTPGSQQTITTTASCQCLVPSTGYTIRDTIPTGFAYVSSTGGVLNGNVVTFSSIGFSSEYESKNFSITLQATGGGCFVDTAIHDNRTTTIGGLVSTSLASSAVAPTQPSQWATSTLRSKSPTGSWRAIDSRESEDFVLTSNSFVAGNLSVLSFWHYYVTEQKYDGGTVELSTNGGTSWFDAGPYIVQNGYNASMDASAPWSPNARAFNGTSYGQGSGQFINTVVNISPFNGQTVKVRFRMRTDVGNPGNVAMEGWYIDDIMQLNGCGGMVKTGLYNPANVKIDSTVVPVFIKSNGLPTNILSQPVAAAVCPGSSASFSVTASGGTLTYQWQVSTNGGTSYTDVPGGTSATLVIPTVTASMNGYLYRAIVDNGTNSATSVAVVLTVNAITSVAAISNVTTCEGSTALFSSTATGAGLSYQWQSSTDGTNFSNITGATSADLSLTNTSVAQNGTKYRVMVTGTCGSATSQAATLTVNSLPAVSITNIPAEICSSAPALSLSASQTGGTWSGQGVAGSQFVPNSLSAGNYLISYTLTNTAGCTGVASTSIVVKNCADRTLPLSHDGTIKIWNNPSQGDFAVELRTDRYQKLYFRVYEADGKLVYQKKVHGLGYGSVETINLIRMAAGVYFLSLYDDKTGDERTFKLLIAR